MSQRFETMEQAITYVFASLAKTDWRGRGLDENTRNPKFTQQLLNALGLPAQPREYAVVTGSKGKGSTTVLTAKVLQHLGHTVGTITSPHLLHYCERFRINGVMMPEADFLRILNDLHPEIDRLIATLPEHDYLSPQGIFLAVGLRWFDENNVAVAVVEVGRGGRFDDNRLVKHKLSLFTPIFLEHTRYLGATLERIAWHKAGIIEPMSYAYSLPQDKSVLDVLQAEAEKQQAEFAWISQTDIGQFTRADDENQWFTLGRYGELQLSMLGRYEVDNATLAIWGAGNVHSRLGMEKLPHRSEAYVQAVHNALKDIRWYGRLQKLQTRPLVYVDGAVNVHSAHLFVESVRAFLVPPVVVVLAVPTDRDLIGVSNVYAPLADALIYTRSARNVAIDFLDEANTLARVRTLHPHTDWKPTLAQAVEVAMQRAGTAGTILLALAQPAIADAMALWGVRLDPV